MQTTLLLSSIYDDGDGPFSASSTAIAREILFGSQEESEDSKQHFVSSYLYHREILYIF